METSLEDTSFESVKVLSKYRLSLSEYSTTATDNSRVLIVRRHMEQNLGAMSCRAQCKFHSFFFSFVTGKNATLGRYAEQRPHLRFLYMAFNVSLAKDFYTKCDNQCTLKYREFFTALVCFIYVMFIYVMFMLVCFIFFFLFSLCMHSSA